MNDAAVDRILRQGTVQSAAPTWGVLGHCAGCGAPIMVRTAELFRAESPSFHWACALGCKFNAGRVQLDGADVVK